MRGVYVGGKERKRECREFFFSFFYLLQICFFKERLKRGVYVGVVMGKN